MVARPTVEELSELLASLLKDTLQHPQALTFKRRSLIDNATNMLVSLCSNSIVSFMNDNTPLWNALSNSGLTDYKLRWDQFGGGASDE